jgi:hypothetical protein
MIFITRANHADPCAEDGSAGGGRLRDGRGFRGAGAYFSRPHPDLGWALETER